MKHLLNLRTPAIAVEIGPYKSLEFSSMGLNGKTVPMLMVYGGKNTHAVQIPEGEWKILGRADEIANDIDHLKTLLTAKELHANFFNWQSYCTENGLTNQLILIKNAD